MFFRGEGDGDLVIFDHFSVTSRAYFYGYLEKLGKFPLISRHLAHSAIRGIFSEIREIFPENLVKLRNVVYDQPPTNNSLSLPLKNLLPCWRLKIKSVLISTLPTQPYCSDYNF